jgi:hypothetical protein
MPAKQLTDGQISHIRKLYALKDGRTAWGVPRLAKEFGVSPARIRAIVADVSRGTTFRSHNESNHDAFGPWIDQ